ncbi:2-phosphosulfolactate phosphatase [Leifsonia xyli]|uniref:2-phosphosulfolactate phosphatase n=1 Tax=Leifsonia xyli TaxID=1575 RepID=UPI003D66691D
MTEQTVAAPTLPEPPLPEITPPQAKYQVRFDWGVEGAAVIGANADVIVWVDALPEPSAGAPEFDGDGAVLAADLTSAQAAARWILAEQVRLGRRAMVAVVAAGAPAAASHRFAVEDLLAAGAVVDALAAAGIDYSSPEAAAACAAFTGLRGAVAHLLTASVAGQKRIAAGASPADVAAAGRLGASDAVTVLRASRQTGARLSE